jgi:hypothetical protein
MRTDCLISVSDLSVASSDCVVCAFLLRAAEPRWRHEYLSRYITRDKSALTIEGYGRRILRLGTTLGKCNESICTSQATYCVLLSLESLHVPETGLQVGFPRLPEYGSSTHYALLREWLQRLGGLISADPQ